MQQHNRSSAQVGAPNKEKVIGCGFSDAEVKHPLMERPVQNVDTAIPPSSNVLHPQSNL